MNKLHINLLSKKQLVGKSKLEIFNKIPISTECTDFVLMQGGSDAYNTCSDSFNTNRIPYRRNVTVSKDGFDDVKSTDQVNIRPVIRYSEIANLVTNKYVDNNGILIAEFGEYPTKCVTGQKLKYLVKKVMSYDYEDVDKAYHIRSKHMYNNFSELLIDNEKYIAFTHVCISLGIREKLATKDIYPFENMYIVKVEPIKWLVDKKTGLAISKDVIACYNLFEPIDTYHGQYINTDLYRYINECFRFDIIPSKVTSKFKDKPVTVEETTKEEEKEIENDKSKEILKIVNEINEYMKYYHGNIDIANRIKSLVREYNSNIDKSVSIDSGILTLDNYNKDYLYTKLLTDLNEILDGLKINYENNKVYHDIIELTKNCLDITFNNIHETNNELVGDIKTIVDTIIPFLNNDKALNTFRNIFSEELDSLTEEQNKMLNLKSKINCKYQTVEEYTSHIRIKILFFLINIYGDITNKSIIQDIINKYKDIANNNYNESNNVLIKTYLNTINDLVNYVRNNGIDEEIDELNKLLSLVNVDEFNLNIVIDNLVNIIKKLYMITFKIEDRNSKKRVLKDYKVKITSK